MYSGHTDKNGYITVSITHNGIDYDERIHRLVCRNFNGEEPTGKIFVNHKNGNTSDNRAINLEWVTPQENTIHAHKTGLIKHTKGTGGHPVVKLDINNNFIDEYVSIKQAHEETGVARCDITRICKGEGFLAGGFKWLYKKDYIPHV